jgi:hypothetical protein
MSKMEPAVEEACMTGRNGERRRYIAIILYGIALAFLVGGVVLYALTSDVAALLEGLLPLIGIGLCTTAILRRESSK